MEAEMKDDTTTTTVTTTTTTVLTDIHTMTAEQLKAELSSYNLQVTGRKQTLIERLQNHRQKIKLEAAAEDEEMAVDDNQLADQDEVLVDALLSGDSQKKSEKQDPANGLNQEEMEKVEEKKEEEEPVVEVPPPPKDIVDNYFMQRYITFEKLGHELRNAWKSNCLTVYPVVPTDLTEGFMATFLDEKCCSYMLKLTPASIQKGKLGWLTMRFKTMDCLEKATDELKEWKTDITVTKKNLPAGLTDDELIHGSGNRVACVVGTPTSITDTELLELLPGYAATVCHNKAGDHNGICFVEFLTDELADLAVENLHKEHSLVMDGQRFYVFQLHRSKTLPVEGGVMRKKDMMTSLNKAIALRYKLIDGWAQSSSTDNLRTQIQEIEKAESGVVDDVKLREKYHLPFPNVYLSIIEEIVRPKLMMRPLGVRPLASLSVDELHIRLQKRDNNKKTRDWRKANKQKAIAYNKEGGDVDGESTERMVTTDGKAKPSIKVTVTDGTTPGKKQAGNQKRAGLYDKGPINKRQRGSFSPRGGLGRSSLLPSHMRGQASGFAGRGGSSSQGRGGYGNYSSSFGGYSGGYAANRGNLMNEQGFRNEERRGYGAEAVGYGQQDQARSFGADRGSIGSARPNVQQKVMSIVQQLTEVLSDSPSDSPQQPMRQPMRQPQGNFRGGQGGYY